LKLFMHRSVVDDSPTVASLRHGLKQLSFFIGNNPSSRYHSTSVKTIPIVPKIHSLERNLFLHLNSNVNKPKHVAVDLVGPRPAGWWTGKVPKYGLCPGVEADGCIYSLPQLTFDASRSSIDKSLNAMLIKKSLQDYFDNTWTMTEVLLASLQGEEAFQVPPYHDLRHPMIFYYGHPGRVTSFSLRSIQYVTVESIHASCYS